MECDVVHAIEGRVRLRVAEPAIFNGCAPAFASALARRPGVRGVHLNAGSQSVVVTYEPEVATGDEMVDTIRALTVDTLEKDVDAGAGEADGGSTVTLALSSAAVALGLVTESMVVGALVLGAAVPIFVRAVASVREKRKLNV